MRLLDAGQNLHQRALARPILADDRKDFTPMEINIHASQRDDAGKISDYALRGQKRGGGAHIDP
jgi:hypothetical protein